MADNESLQTLLLQHNSIGGKSFYMVGTAIEHHPNLTYLDISYNNLQNSGFQHIFFPISRNKTKLEDLQCRCNGIGGPAVDKLLYSMSHSLKTLNLASNELTELNGRILHDYARGNFQIEQIVLDNNDQVNADNISSINKECRLNIQIKEFILPRLPKAADTGF